VVVLGIGLLLVSGCAPESKYDIDVECLDSPTFEVGIRGEDETSQTFLCFTPKFFKIRCDWKSVNRLDDTFLCSTHDNKSVRIRVVSASE